MTNSEYRAIESWFHEHTHFFHETYPEHRDVIDLKYNHTLRVCKEVEDSVDSLNLNQSDRFIARATGLLHDIGRFEQYCRHTTFVDARSMNHGAYGGMLLRREGVLERLDSRERSIILFAVENHNAFRIPDPPDERHRFFTCIIRDADKLDILRVMTDFYRTGRYRECAASLQIDLPSVDSVTIEVAEELIRGKLIRNETLRTIHDFKLMQMGWVFDINFPHTLTCIRERKYCEMLRESLPSSDQVSKAFDVVMQYVEKGTIGHYSKTEMST